MEGAFIGSIIFEFVGAFAKWTYYVVRNGLRGKESPGFMRLWIGRKGQNLERSISEGFSNVVLGMLIVVIIVSIMMIVKI